MRIYKELIISCLLSIIFGCSKQDSASPPPPPDNESPVVAEKLIGNWIMTAQTSSVAWDWNGDGTTETDMYANYSTCLKQKGLTISADKTGSVKQSCTLTNNIEWLVTDYGKVFRFRINYGSGNFSAYADNGIQEITPTSLKLTIKTDVPGGPQGVIITYTYTR